MELREGFIICDSHMKEKISREQQEIKNYIFLTQEQLQDKLNFQIHKSAVFQIMKHYSFSYTLSLDYLQAIRKMEKGAYNNPKLDSIVSVMQYLEEKKLIEKDLLFPFRLKQFPVTFINPEPTKEYEKLKKKVSNITAVFEVFQHAAMYQPALYEIPTILEECLFVMNHIRRLIEEGVSLNHIFILNTDHTYIDLFKRLSKSFAIPIQFEAGKNIVTSSYIQKFLTLCETEQSFSHCINKLDKANDFYKIIVDTINSYELVEELPLHCIPFLKSLFKTLAYPIPHLIEAIHFGQDTMVFSEKDYVFYLGFNLGSSPKVEKEQGFLNDADLNLLGLSTSVEKNKYALDKLKSFLFSTPHLILTYKRVVNQEKFLPSPLVDTLGLTPILIESIEYGFSKVEDELRLIGLYDLYLKYGQWHSDLESYGIQNAAYKTYTHNYKPLSKETLGKHFEKKPLRLAYSNVKLYFACPFSYYADRILGLNEFKPQMAARLGTFSHAVLEDSYQEDFDFNLAVEQHTKENALDEKDKFFFQQMTEVLRNIIPFNKTHEQDSKLSTIVREAHIEVIKTTYSFEGYIDKLMFTIQEDEVYAAIVDYKTGADIVSLDNMEDGFHLQLPAYMYLLSKYYEFKGKNLHIIGIYLQKVNIVIYDHKSDVEQQMNKRFMLEGYSVASSRLLSMLDPSHMRSTYIKSLGMTKDGFLKYSKVFLEAQQEEIIQLVENLLDGAAEQIQQGIFPIAPKKIRGKNESCMFCKYKDLCFCDYEDEIELSYKPFGKRGEGDGMDGNAGAGNS